MSPEDPAEGLGVDQSRAAARDPWAHRRAEPRAFAFLWTCWLLAVTALSIGRLGRLGLSSYEIYRPSARVLITGVFVGCAVFWPLVRLSQERPGRPLRSLLADLIVVVAPAAAIITSQSLPGMAGWSIWIAVYLIAYLTAWATGIAGGMVLIMHSSASRWVGMLAFLTIAAVGPMLGLVFFDPGASPQDLNPWLMVSPFTVTYEITRDRFWTGDTAVILKEHMYILGAVWLVAAGVAATGAARSRDLAGLPSAHP